MGHRKIAFFVALAIAIGCAADQPVSAPEPIPGATALPSRDAWDGEIPDVGQGCTTVYATDGKQMLGGNNEDSADPLTKVWFVPATEDTYGQVYFGYENYRPQGGINDQGLFFDMQAVDETVRVDIEGKQPYTGTHFIVYDAMRRCATVACVVEMFETYYDQEYLSYQHLFGDATGESAIVEPQAILRQRGGYQVVTNFFQSMVPPEERDSECWRYKAATSMLEGSPALSVETIRDVMTAVSRDKRPSLTLYTNVYDLANRMVYLYHFHDYEHVVVIDLEEELAKGAHSYDLPVLFPANSAAEQYSAPLLRSYHNVIRSHRVDVGPGALAAFAGDYTLPESAPDDWIRIVPYGTSLMMMFPDSHRYELFPQGDTSFFVVTWNKGNRRFDVQFDVNFGIDDARQVLYMDLVFGQGDEYVRFNRQGLASFVPYLPSPTPTTTPRPTLTPQPIATARPRRNQSDAPLAASSTPHSTATRSDTPLEATSTLPAPTSDAGLRWEWAILPAAVLAATIGFLVIRRRRPSG